MGFDPSDGRQADGRRMTIRAGLVGLGKIARDQHLPAIAKTDGIDLIAVASRNAALFLNYRFTDGALKGLGFSWRNASLRGNSSTADQDENRLIVSYSLPLL